MGFRALREPIDLSPAELILRSFFLYALFQFLMLLRALHKFLTDDSSQKLFNIMEQKKICGLTINKSQVDILIIIIEAILLLELNREKEGICKF